jgi:hypothetical protein
MKLYIYIYPSISVVNEVLGKLGSLSSTITLLQDNFTKYDSTTVLKVYLKRTISRSIYIKTRATTRINFTLHTPVSNCARSKSAAETKMLSIQNNYS